MSTATATIGAIKRTRVQWAIADGIAIMWRNLISYTRIPDALFFSSVQPVMFILLFRYVFGGAIPIPGVRYVDYLMPGIFMQTVAFGAIGTAIGLADDLQKGIIERFRSLPMARSAVLVGRTAADMVRNVFVFLLMTGVGFAVGFRVHTNVLSYIAAGAVLLMFSFSLAWGFAIVGLSAPNSETAQLMAFPILLPLSFASSAFVPIITMPNWLQVFARNQPATAVVDAVRALCLGNVPAATPVFKSVLWSVGILVVLAPIAVRKYRRAV
jgi:ABC-2 type transport system permease protein